MNDRDRFFDLIDSLHRITTKSDFSFDDYKCIEKELEHLTLRIKHKSNQKLIEETNSILNKQ